MHLRVLSQTVPPNFLNSLRESGSKLSAGDEGGFMHWLGQGDRYAAFSLICPVQLIGLSNFASTNEECPCLEDILEDLCWIEY